MRQRSIRDAASVGAGGSGGTGFRRAGRRRIGWLLSAVAVAVGGVAATGVAAVQRPDPELSPEVQRVLSAVDGVFAEGCVPLGGARADVRAALDAAGLGTWEVVPGQGTGDCVTAGVDPTKQQVVLIPAIPPKVAGAMEGVRRELMDRCLEKDEAIAFVSSLLESLGVEDWSITTDGPVGGPEGSEQALREHIAAGCFVYTGSGHDGDGRPFFNLSGLET